MMRRTLYLSGAVILALIFGCGDKPLPASKTSGLIVEGLELLVRQTSGEAMVTFGFYLKGGANYTGADRAGIEALLLNTAVRATETRSRESLRNRLAALQTTFEVISRLDYTGLVATTPLDNFSRVWEIFSDILMRPRLEVGEVRAIRSRMLADRSADFTGPGDQAFQIAFATYYKKHPYRLGNLGNENTLAALQRNDLVEFYRNDFTKNRALLVVVGDLSVKEVTLVARQLARSLPQGPELLAPAVSFNAGGSDVAVERKSLPTNFITGLISAPRLGHPDYPQYRVALELLRQRAFGQLSSRRGLTHNVLVEDGRVYANYGVISFSTSDPADATQVIRATIKDLRTEELDELEVAGAAKQVLIEHLLESGNLDQQLRQIAQWGIVAEDWRQLEQFPLELAKINSLAVEAIFRKYFHSVHWGAVGPSRRMSRSLFIGN